MTGFGKINYSISSFEKKRIQKSEEKIKNTQFTLINRNPSLFSVKAIDYGIDEFGRSEVLKTSNYSIAERIKRNPGAKAPIESSVLDVLKKDYEIYIPNGYEKSRKARFLRDFMIFADNKMIGTWRKACYELAVPGIFYGNNILEKTYYDLPSEHKYKNKRIYRELIGRFPGVWSLKEDIYNQVYGIESLFTHEIISIEKFVLFTWLRQYGRAEGSAVLDSIYKYLQAKDIIYQNMLSFVNNYSGKIPIVEYSDINMREIAEDIAENLKAGCGLAIPEGVKIEFINALEGNDTDAFFILFNWCDSQAYMAIKGTSGFSVNNGTGSGTGSYNADEIKKEVGDIYTKFLQMDLEEIWYEQICKPLLIYNFDNIKYPEEIFPRLRFIDKNDIPLKETRENIKLGLEKEVLRPDERIDDEIYIRNALYFPQLNDKEIQERKSLESQIEYIDKSEKITKNLDEDFEDSENTEDIEDDLDNEDSENE